MTILGAELLLDLLENDGIEHIICSPGSEWTPIWEGLLRRYDKGNKKLKYINCRHEMLAVSLATGYYKATGKISAVLLHTGVGTLHGAMGIRAAYNLEIPMIIFSGETYTHVSDEEVKAPGTHWVSHLADIGGPAALVKPFIKWSNSVTTAEGLIDSVNRGYQIAQTNPRGPVLISATRELLMKPFHEVKLKPPYPIPELPVPPKALFEKVAQQLIESKQPMIITEHIGKQPENIGKLIKLAELLSIPVFEGTYPSFNNFPKNHPLYMGSEVTKAFKEADMVLAVGCTNAWYSDVSQPKSDAKTVLLDENPVHERIPYWGLEFDSVLSGDIGLGMTTLIELVKSKIKKSGFTEKVRKEKLEHWKNRHDQMVEQWNSEALAGAKNKPISSKWFFLTLNKNLPENSVVMEETLLHSRVMRKYLTVPEMFVKSVTGGLGIGLGETIGLKLANPGKPVVFIVGDGTFGYNPVIAGLGLSQEYKLPILTIVLNNGGYMVMKLGYHAMYPDGFATTHDKYLGVNITPEPEYTRIAEAFGAYAEKVEDAKNVEPALKRALEQLAKGRSALLDVVVDKNKFPF